MELQDEVPIAIQESSEPFIGRWQGLVSTTNWEKGRIIWEWRQSLQQSDADAIDYSDETWSQMVGGVTAQHVGRLRRVHERFGDVFSQYEGLYWSHFHAALDWEDAELWLEGAVQKKWSISQMRRERAETLGTIVGQTAEVRVIEGTIEDVAALAEANVAADVGSEPLTSSVERVKGSEAKESQPESSSLTDAGSSELDDGARADSGREDIRDEQRPEAVRPFEKLPDLPSDLTDAVEGLKLAILRHKTDGWREVSCDHVLACLDAMKVFATTATDSRQGPN